MAAIESRDLGIAKLLWAFAILSLALTGALAIAPARSRASEWRKTQQRYNALAKKRGKAQVPIAIQQIWKPELGVVDRCTSCHLGMGRSGPLAGSRLFAAHPAIPHDPNDLGCTVCHGGQGRATTAAAAHGKVEHWDAPLLERGTEEAGCGHCHSNLPVAAPALAQHGREIFTSSGCPDCHRVGGTGGSAGPDLSAIGLHDYRSDWHTHHIESSAEAAEGDDATAASKPWRAGFAPLADEDVAVVEDYLHSLVGAPRLMNGKTLAHSLGCRGCHRIGGVGGDDGPDLSNEGHKLVADLDFSHVKGRPTLRNWLVRHFLSPGRVVAGSQMPNFGLDASQADALALYMLSLQSGSIPESAAPRDRVRGLRLGEREFATDGESLFGVFCTGCHGERGEGRRLAQPHGTGRAPVQAAPAVANPAFLMVAEDAFLRRTLVDGRAGRRMPAWGTKDGGLRPEEIDALVRYLRSRVPEVSSFEDVMAATPDVEAGLDLFARDCVPCHGTGGAGTVLAPPLAAEDNLTVRSDNAIYGTLATGIGGTAMRPFAAYDAASLRSVIAAVRSLPPTGAHRTGWSRGSGDAEHGAALFHRACEKCHGDRGAGLTAPALANPQFLAAATEGYLTATIIRGRPGTKMPVFGRETPDAPALQAAEVADIVAFLRRDSGPQGN